MFFPPGCVILVSLWTEVSVGCEYFFERSRGLCFMKVRFSCTALSLSAIYSVILLAMFVSFGGLPRRVGAVDDWVLLVGGRH